MNNEVNNKPTFKELVNNLKKNRLFVSFFIVVILLIIVSLIYIIVKDNNGNSGIGEKGDEKIEKVETSDVETIYGYLSTVDCDKNLVWDFSTNSKIDIKTIDTGLKVKIVLSRIDADEKLNDTLTAKVFEEYARSVLGKSEGNKLEISTIEYKGSNYTIGNDNTTITSDNSCSESKYVSKLFGYTYNENELSVDIAVGSINDNKLYDMEGKEVGSYSDDSTMKEILSNSTIYRYGFYKEDNNYILDNVTKVVTVKGPTE